MKRPLAIGTDEIDLSEEESENMVGTDEFQVQPKRNKQLQLADSLRQSVKSLDPTMSCELGSHGIKLNKEGYEISTTGMKDISSGQMIVGNLCEEDLEYGDDTILGNGASGYVYLATHKVTGQQMALKSINVFD